MFINFIKTLATLTDVNLTAQKLVMLLNQKIYLFYMDLIKPKKLKKGDTIAIISPSAGLAAIFPHRLDNAIKFLKSRGFKIKEFPTTRKIKGWESAPAKERANDIMDAFLDKKVKAIICSIGGYNSNKTLKYLDFKKIRENPKVFCGFSDTSVLHYAIYKKAGLITFYGPSMMNQFGEYPVPLEYTINHFKKAVIDKNSIGKIKPSKEWTDELLDWGQKKDLERPRKMRKNKSYEWLKKGKASGKIIGGCLSSILHLIGTEYWPDHKNKILFIEIPEGQEFGKGEPLPDVDAFLSDLDNAKIFSQIKGLIIGRPFQYSNEDFEKFKKIILDNTKDYDFPILFGADIGHTDPQITIPLGAEVKINSEKNNFEIL